MKSKKVEKKKKDEKKKKLCGIFKSEGYPRGIFSKYCKVSPKKRRLQDIPKTSIEIDTMEAIFHYFFYIVLIDVYGK